jgi:microcystin-dependent protein
MTAINISFSEGSNKIAIEEGAFNKQTSLTLIGKNASNYAVPFAENFLHLLENFASRTPPVNAVAGQLWFDTTPAVKALKVYSGTSWVPAGAVKKSTATPEDNTSLIGDLWVNPKTRQLFMYSGTTWDLIGPQYSSGTKTGPMVETIKDINDISHSILTIYANSIRVGIIAGEEFTPKIYMLGFAILKKGFNLSTNDLVGEENKLWGIADSSTALMCDGEYVPATNFLRGDKISTSFVSLNIRDNDGITVGSELGFKISTASDNSVFLTSKKNTPITFNFYHDEDGSSPTVMFLDPNYKVGIGQDNTAPREALDVLGNVVISGVLDVSDITPASSTVAGSIRTGGGLTVAQNSIFQSTTEFQDTVTVGMPSGGVVLVPNYTNDEAESEDQGIPLRTQPLIDIGTETRQFRNVYAESFNGSFTGIFDGTLTGNLVGPATSLAENRMFSLTGDIASEPVPFDGTASVIMTTTISPNFISSKTSATTSLDTDQILTFRASTGVQRTTKSLFLKSVPSVPIGAIFPFAGIAVPDGYLFCDGSEIPVATYGELFSTIRYSYRSQSTLVGAGTFALPDLRGRFALGRDNMDNDLTVVTPSKQTVNAGGNRNGAGTLGTDSAKRVTNVSANNLGGYGGSEAIGDPASIDAVGSTASLSSGGQVSSILNPYQTINYIIFTGVFS